MTQQDPVGDSVGNLNAANRYTYADDDPVNVFDPNGTAITPQCVFGTIASSAAVIVAIAEGGPPALALIEAIFAGTLSTGVGAGIIGIIAIIGSIAWLVQAILYCAGVP